MTDFNLKRWPNSDDYNLCMDETVIQERMLRRKAYDDDIYCHYDSQSGKLFDALDLRNTRKSLSEDHTWLPQFLDLIRRSQSYDYKLVHDPSCVLHLPFWAYKNPTIPYIYDLSGNNNHGTITGAVPASYPILSGTELVSNGGMESGDPPTGWTNNGLDTFEQSAVQKHSGSNSLHFVSLGTGFRGGRKESIPVVPNKNYLFKIWYYLVAVTDALYLQIVDDGDSEELTATTVSTTGSFLYKEMLFNSKSYSSIRLKWYRNNAFEGYIDDVSVQEVVGYEGLGWGFDGVDDRITITNSTSLNSITSATQIVWARWSQQDGADIARIIGRSDYVMDFGVMGGTGALQYFNGGWIDTTYVVVPNKWLCIALGWNGSNVLTYVNGAYIGSTANVSWPDNKNLYVGSAVGAPSGSLWKGQVGEVLIFNRAWSATELLNYFNATKGRYGVA